MSIIIKNRGNQVIIEGVGTFAADALRWEEQGAFVSIYDTDQNRYVLYRARVEVLQDVSGEPLVALDQATGEPVSPLETVVQNKLDTAPVRFAVRNRQERHYVGSGTWTKLVNCWDDVYLESEDFDTALGRFVAPRTGEYQFGAHVSMYLYDTKKLIVALYKNGSRFALLGRGTAGADDICGFGGGLLVAMQAGDYAECWVYQNAANNNFTYPYGGYNTFWGYLND